MTGSPARLIGRWSVRWSKLHGPFLFETDDPEAALEFPLAGALCGLGYRGADDNAIIALYDGVRPVVALDARRADPRPLYARATMMAAGAAPIRIQAGGRGWLRLFAVCFAEPQPWLPLQARLDSDRLVGCLAAQAARGTITPAA
jgi:hypothetical protein